MSAISEEASKKIKDIRATKAPAEDPVVPSKDPVVPSEDPLCLDTITLDWVKISFRDSLCCFKLCLWHRITE